MISYRLIASRIQRERARVRSEPAETTLTFYSLPPKRLCYHGGNSVFISVVSFRTEAVTVFWSLALFLIFFIFSSASAQVPPPVGVPFPVDPTGRSGEPPTLPKQFETPTPPPG